MVVLRVATSRDAEDGADRTGKSAHVGGMVQSTFSPFCLRAFWPLLYKTNLSMWLDAAANVDT